MAGLSHHRWITELAGNKLSFAQKSPLMHVDWRFALPESFKARLTPENSVIWHWWEGGFEYEERSYEGMPRLEAELIGFAQQHCPRPQWLYQADAVCRKAASLSRRVSRRLRRVFQ